METAHNRSNRPGDASPAEIRFNEHVVAGHAIVLRSYVAKRHAHAEDIASDAARRIVQAARSGSLIVGGSADDVRNYMFSAARSAEADLYRSNAGRGSQAPKGWYPDPDDETGSVERWWAGDEWTDKIRDRAGQRVAPPKRAWRPQCTVTTSIEGQSRTDADDSYFAPGTAGDEALADLRLDLVAVLEHLTEAQRIAVIRDLEGMTYREVAEERHINPNTANSHRARGMAAVREQLGTTYL